MLEMIKYLELKNNAASLAMLSLFVLSRHYMPYTGVCTLKQHTVFQQSSHLTTTEYLISIRMKKTVPTKLRRLLTEFILYKSLHPSTEGSWPPTMKSTSSCATASLPPIQVSEGWINIDKQMLYTRIIYDCCCSQQEQ